MFIKIEAKTTAHVGFQFDEAQVDTLTQCIMDIRLLLKHNQHTFDAATLQQITHAYLHTVQKAHINWMTIHSFTAMMYDIFRSVASSNTCELVLMKGPLHQFYATFTGAPRNVENALKHLQDVFHDGWWKQVPFVEPTMTPFEYIPQQPDAPKHLIEE